MGHTTPKAYRLIYGADNERGYINEVLEIELFVESARDLPDAKAQAERKIDSEMRTGAWCLKRATLLLSYDRTARLAVGPAYGSSYQYVQAIGKEIGK